MPELTMEKFSAMPAGEMFAKGFALDGTANFNITGREQALRWVAIKGHISDWAVYVGLYAWTWERVRREGDKIHTRDFIHYVVPCTKEVMDRYRP